MKTDLSVSTVEAVSTEKFNWLILFTILLAPLITVIDVFIINVSLPTIQTFFHTSDAAIQGVVASYLVGYSVFLITGSRAGDHFGRKKVFIAGLTIFAISSALCGYAANIEQLIIFRFIQGIAAGFATPQTVTLIQLNFKQSSARSQALGFYGITLGIGAVIGQYLGGYFVTSHWMQDPWRLIFLINVPVGILAVVMGSLFIPESKLSKKANFDIVGVLLLTVALSTLVYPIIQGRELGWPLWTFVMLICSLLLLFVFIRYQAVRSKASKDVLLPLHLFKIRSFNLGLGMVSFYFSLFSAFMLSCALYLQKGHHIDPLTSGSYFVVVGLSFMFSSHWSIKNGSRFGTRLLYVASILVIIGFGIQYIYFGPDLSPVAIISSFLSYGLGAGILVPSFLRITLKDVPHEYAGIASGIYSTIQQFSSALGVSIIGGVFFFVVEKKGGDFDMGYHAAAFCLIGYTLVVMFLLFLFQKMDKDKGSF